MKVHHSKILLFSLPLNILVSSSYEHNKYKTYTKPHHRTTTTSRVLSECDLYVSNYHDDADMKSVKENFDRQTSQRFEEYNEHMNKKRQKCKEQCEKDIQKIIEKDKMEKSLEEKVEKGCLRCGFGLGGVAAGVGIIGPVAVNELKKAALLAAESSAMAEGLAAGEAAGTQEGIKVVMNVLGSDFGLSNIDIQQMGLIFYGTNYTDVTMITKAICNKFQGSCLPPGSEAGSFHVAATDQTFCASVIQKSVYRGNVSGGVSIPDAIAKTVQTMVSEAKTTAGAHTEAAIHEATTALTAQKIGVVNATYGSCQTAIIASVVAILIIVLVMVIIFLILRYRRRKKMNKKQQYTKLLNQ
ncbi:PIR protein, putative [Plasmodium sp.]|nr:PIR protein, putative [Plasmodium sp.]